MFRVNDIFYSLQGEGRNTGRAAVFIRFAGCNLRCPFCDTEFNTYREMSGEEILAEVSSLVTSTEKPIIVLTGGEPTLQVDEAFVDLLHSHGYYVAMESNGTRPAPRNLDWLTVSPKKEERGERREEREGSEPRKFEISRNQYFKKSENRNFEESKLPDEIKIVFEEDTDPEATLAALTLPYSSNIAAPSPLSSLLSPLNPPLGEVRMGLYLQPCDTGDAVRNARITKACVEYIKQNPQWRLSLQTHKLIGIE